jgi:hypothetical protein
LQFVEAGEALTGCLQVNQIPQLPAIPIVINLDIQNQGPHGFFLADQWTDYILGHPRRQFEQQSSQFARLKRAQ